MAHNIPIQRKYRENPDHFQPNSEDITLAEQVHMILDELNVQGTQIDEKQDKVDNNGLLTGGNKPQYAGRLTRFDSSGNLEGISGTNTQLVRGDGTLGYSPVMGRILQADVSQLDDINLVPVGESRKFVVSGLRRPGDTTNTGTAVVEVSRYDTNEITQTAYFINFSVGGSSYTMRRSYHYYMSANWTSWQLLQTGSLTSAGQLAKYDDLGNLTGAGALTSDVVSRTGSGTGASFIGDYMEFDLVNGVHPEASSSSVIMHTNGIMKHVSLSLLFNNGVPILPENQEWLSVARLKGKYLPYFGANDMNGYAAGQPAFYFPITTNYTPRITRIESTGNYEMVPPQVPVYGRVLANGVIQFNAPNVTTLERYFSVANLVYF